MFSEYVSISELMRDFSSSWGAFSGYGSVMLVGLLLAFLGYLVRGVWGTITMLAAMAFVYIFRGDIPLSWLLH